MLNHAKDSLYGKNKRSKPNQRAYAKLDQELIMIEINKTQPTKRIC